jgi:hypothetical protein
LISVGSVSKVICLQCEVCKISQTNQLARGVRSQESGASKIVKEPRLRGAAARARRATSRVANRRFVDLRVRNGKSSGMNDMQTAKRGHLTLLKAIERACKAPDFIGLAATWEMARVKFIFRSSHTRRMGSWGTPFHLGHPSGETNPPTFVPPQSYPRRDWPIGKTGGQGFCSAVSDDSSLDTPIRGLYVVVCLSRTRTFEHVGAKPTAVTKTS